jgi:hypothetical protein
MGADDPFNNRGLNFYRNDRANWSERESGGASGTGAGDTKKSGAKRDREKPPPESAAAAPV